MTGAAPQRLDLAPAGTPAAAIPPGALWLFAGAIVLVYFCTLGSFALAEPDEPRYAEIAREMLELRDWVTPHLNYVKYFEKPPLIYWLTSVNVRLFGLNEFVVRLWPVLFALLGIACAYALGRSMYDRWVGAVAAALLAAMPFYFGLGQVLILDMPLTGLLTVALTSFWFAYTGSPRRRAWVWLLYGATALAVLTKGPVAVVLTAGVILAFLLLRWDLAALRWLISPFGAVLFLAVTLPWFVLVSHRNPEFLEFFVVKQHLDRFLRPNEHQQPLWFFLPIVFGGALPWALFVLYAPGNVAAFAARTVRRRTSPAALYCVLWSGVVLVFFSLSGSKLATYVLPMFCPLAILLARFCQQQIAAGSTAVFARVCISLIVASLIVVVGAFGTAAVLDRWEVGYIVSRAYVGMAALAATGVVALRLTRQRRLQAALAVLIIGVLGLQVIAMTGRGIAAHYRALGLLIRQYAKPGDQVVVYRHYVQGIPFYAQRRTIMVGGWGELEFGRLQGDQRAFFWPSDAELLSAWSSGRRMLLVINRSELEPLHGQLRPPPRLLGGQDKKVLLANFD